MDSYLNSFLKTEDKLSFTVQKGASWPGKNRVNVESYLLQMMILL